MKTLFKFLLFILAGSMLFFSCKKNDDDPKPLPNNNRELLIGQWAHFSYAYEFNGVEFEELVEPCISDDIITISSDNTYSVEDGPLICEEEGPLNYSSEYILSQNDTYIEFLDEGQDYTGYIYHLTESVLVMKLDYVAIDIYYKFRKIK